MIFLPARWPEGLLAWLLFRPGSCAAEAKVVLRDSYIDHGNLEPRALEAALGHTPLPKVPCLCPLHCTYLPVRLYWSFGSPSPLANPTPVLLMLY